MYKKSMLVAMITLLPLSMQGMEPLRKLCQNICNLITLHDVQDEKVVTYRKNFISSSPRQVEHSGLSSRQCAQSQVVVSAGNPRSNVYDERSLMQDNHDDEHKKLATFDESYQKFYYTASLWMDRLTCFSAVAFATSCTSRAESVYAQDTLHSARCVAVGAGLCAIVAKSFCVLKHDEAFKVAQDAVAKLRADLEPVVVQSSPAEPVVSQASSPVSLPSVNLEVISSPVASPVVHVTGVESTGEAAVISATASSTINSLVVGAGGNLTADGKRLSAAQVGEEVRVTAVPGRRVL